jgi:hypothetical protein
MSSRAAIFATPTFVQKSQMESRESTDINQNAAMVLNIQAAIRGTTLANITALVECQPLARQPHEMDGQSARSDGVQRIPLGAVFARPQLISHRFSARISCLPKSLNLEFILSSFATRKNNYNASSRILVQDLSAHVTSSLRGSPAATLPFVLLPDQVQFLTNSTR